MRERYRNGTMARINNGEKGEFPIIGPAGIVAELLFYL